MRPSALRWLKFAVRWGIAIVGIGYVLSNISLWDHVTMVESDGRVASGLRLAATPQDVYSFTSVRVKDPSGGEREVPRSAVLSRPDRDRVRLADGVETRLLGVQLEGDFRRMEQVRVVRLLVDAGGGVGRWVEPSEAPTYQLSVPNPPIETGLASMVRQADELLLALALGIFPIVFYITGYRWHLLLRALDIEMGLRKAMVINMVGAFYNTFMPGVTGGDVLKAYYAAKQTTHRTRAVMSVIIDRAIGLMALIIMGGVMSAAMYAAIGDPTNSVAQRCRQVAVGALVIVAGVSLGVVLILHPALRRGSGLSWLIKRLPAQRFFTKAFEVLTIYRRRPALVLATLVMSFPVHAVTVSSAAMSGMALGLPVSPMYYYVAVPVIVLAGSIPISPQGAGVMEFFAIVLLSREGATIAQAFALTLAIRLVSVFWYLVCGVLVFRGGYHAPTAKETEDLGADESPAAPAQNPG